MNKIHSHFVGGVSFLFVLWHFNFVRRGSCFSISFTLFSVAKKTVSFFHNSVYYEIDVIFGEPKALSVRVKIKHNSKEKINKIKRYVLV